MLGKLFKPRWQHRDPQQRIQAIGRLDLGQTEDNQILATLARGDASEAVRCAAAGRLTDLKQLDLLARQDPSNEVREAAALQVCALLAGTAENAPLAENRLRLVLLTDNQQVLGHVARQGIDMESRKAAIARLEDQTALFQLAIEADTAELRLSAAERVSEPELLKKLSREGRDKKVQRHAREQARELQQQDQLRQQQQAERTRLIEQLEQHARRGADPLYQAKLEQLDRQWHQISTDASEEQRQQAQQWLTTCQQRIDAWREAEAEAQRASEAADEQREALATLNTLAQQLQPEQWQSELGSLRAAVQTQLNRWQSANGYRAAEETLRVKFDSLAEAWQQGLEIAGQLTEMAPSDSEQLEQLRNAWPDHLPAPAPLAQAEPESEAASEQPPATTANAPGKADSAMPALLGALNRELQRRNLRHANRLWHKAEALLEEEPDSPEKSRHQARMEKLKPALDELRDWHSFAAEPKKVILCERMEALDDTALDPAEKATAIQALHDEWRELMSSNQDADQALWERFKSASDRAYEPCREYFREQDAEKQANLKKREALCDQLEAYIGKQDWLHADWPAVWEIRQQAPKEWRDYQPIKFTDVRDLQKRFSGLLGQLDQALEEASNTHAQRLEQLITKAEALSESDDIHSACEQARELQQQWKNTDWVFPRQYRPLNKRFRKACDQLFQSRDSARQAQKAEHAEQEQALDQALKSLSQALGQPIAQIDSGALNQQAEACRELPCPPHARALRERRNDLLTRVKKLNEALPQWRRWQTLHDRVASASEIEETPEHRKLAVTLEVLVGEASPEADREQRMALQLELLPKAMKAGAETASLKKVEELLQKYDATIHQGLDAQIRERLLNTLEKVKPLF